MSYLTLFNGRRQYPQTRIGLIQVKAARLADMAALFKALRGGWHPLQEKGTRVPTGAGKG